MPISREKYRHGFLTCPEASNPYCIILPRGKMSLVASLPATIKAGFRLHMAIETMDSFSAKKGPVSLTPTLSNTSN